MDEIWRDIKDYEGLYQISNLGRVKSMAKFAGCSWRKEKILDPYVDKYKYCKRLLSNNGKHKVEPVHRLVANAFIPNPENKRTVNHKDGVKINNCVTNLEWNTHKENDAHARKIGLTIGHKGIHTKLTDKQVINILKLKGKKTLYKISLLYPVSTATISRIFNGLAYIHITNVKLRSH